MSDNSITASGVVEVVLRDADGHIVQQFRTHNLVVQTGLEYVAGLLGFTGSPDQISHIGVGTSSVGPSGEQTDLVSPLGDRAEWVNRSTSSASFSLTADFLAGESTGAITECGLFNSFTAGAMICRTVFDVVNKSATNSLSITWTISIT